MNRETTTFFLLSAVYYDIHVWNYDFLTLYWLSYPLSCFPSGFAGELCDYEYNECESNPCLNDGECIDQIGGYECKCSKGYIGNRCQMKVRFWVDKSRNYKILIGFYTFRLIFVPTNHVQRAIDASTMETISAVNAQEDGMDQIAIKSRERYVDCLPIFVIQLTRFEGFDMNLCIEPNLTTHFYYSLTSYIRSYL